MRVGKFRLLGVLITFVIVSIVLAACGDSEARSTSIADQATEGVEEPDDGERSRIKTSKLTLKFQKNMRI